MYGFLLCSGVKTQSTRNPASSSENIKAANVAEMAEYDDVKNATLEMNLNLKLYSTSRSRAIHNSKNVTYINDDNDDVAIIHDDDKATLDQDDVFAPLLL